MLFFTGDVDIGVTQVHRTLTVARTRSSRVLSVFLKTFCTEVVTMESLLYDYNFLQKNECIFFTSFSIKVKVSITKDTVFNVYSKR